MYSLLSELVQIVYAKINSDGWMHLTSAFRSQKLLHKAKGKQKIKLCHFPIALQDPKEMLLWGSGLLPCLSALERRCILEDAGFASASSIKGFSSTEMLIMEQQEVMSGLIRSKLCPE